MKCLSFFYYKHYSRLKNNMEIVEYVSSASRVLKGLKKTCGGAIFAFYLVIFNDTFLARYSFSVNCPLLSSSLFSYIISVEAPRPHRRCNPRYSKCIYVPIFKILSSVSTEHLFQQFKLRFEQVPTLKGCGNTL